jgi:metal transporter CNNM
MASAISASRSAMSGVNGSRAGRVNMLLDCIFHAFAPLVKALPLGGIVNALAEEELPKSPEDASLWVYLGIAVALVLAGGVFAGLTIAYAHTIPRLCHD